MTRRAARVDANLSAIVADFRHLGCSVNVRNDDMADLDVGYGGLSMIVEVKDGRKPPSARKLTANQVKRRETWTGGIYLVQCQEDVLRAVNTLRSWHAKLALGCGLKALHKMLDTGEARYAKEHE